MGIGYSILSSTLNITGTAKSAGIFDVHIESVETLTKTSGAKNEPGYPTYTNDVATLKATFNAPGDYITYQINVANTGTIDASINVETNLQAENDSFKMSCNAVNGTVLYAHEGKVSFECKIVFDEDYSLTSIPSKPKVNMSLKIRALQKAKANIPEPPYNPTFIVNSSGVITAYNSDETNVVIPDTYTESISTGEYTFVSDKCIDLLQNVVGLDLSNATSL